MSMIDLDAPTFSDNQLSSHCVVISSLKLLIGVKVGMIASLDPHMETSVVTPASSHEVSCCQVLFSFSFVHIKHEEKEFFGHFGYH